MPPIVTTINLEVAPYVDKGAMSFTELQLYHAGCAITKPMQIRRSIDSNAYSIECSCGLQIKAPVFGAAVTDIQAVSINEEPRRLKRGSYKSSISAAIFVSSRQAL